MSVLLTIATTPPTTAITMSVTTIAPFPPDDCDEDVEPGVAVELDEDAELDAGVELGEGVELG